MACLQNIALHKGTTLHSNGGGNYRKVGYKGNLVDGSKSATFSGVDCSGCFGSYPSSGYWQVNLGQKFFVAHVKIFGLSGEK